MSRPPDKDAPYEASEHTMIDPGILQKLPGASPAGAPPPEEEDSEATMMIQSPALLPKPRAAAAPAAYLQCVAGNDTGRIFPLREATTLIGRGMNCGIILNDPSVSRQHFNIILTGEGYKLIDLGSGNGTRVNGQNVRELLLREGTQIDVGITSLRFGAGQPPPAVDLARARAVAPQPAPPAPIMQRSAQASTDPGARRGAPQPAIAPAAQPPMQMVSPFQQAQVIPDDEPAAKRSTGLIVLLIVVLLVVLGGGGFVAADKFMGLGFIFPKPAPLHLLAAVQPKVDAKVQYEQGLALLKARQWDAALGKFKAVEELDQEIPDLQKKMKSARTERDAGNDADQAQVLLGKGDKDGARKLLSGIPDTSVYYLEAQEKLRTLDQAAGTTAPAPTTGATTAPAPTTGAATAPAPSPAPTHAPAPAPAPAPPTVAGKADVSEAVGLFNAANFPEAEQALHKLAAAATDPATKADLEGLAGAVAAFQKAYLASKTAAEHQRYDEAASALKEAIELNKKMGGRFEPSLKASQAEVLVARAGQSLKKKHYIAAGVDIYEAAKVAPDSPALRSAKEALAAAVEPLIEEARGHMNARQYSDAKPGFELILWLFPDKENRYNREAVGWLDGIKDQPGGLEAR